MSLRKLIAAVKSLYSTGETSAGKSGFINLLIGSDILPVSRLACTSTIVKIHNSTDTEIKITGEQGNTTIIKFVQETDSETLGNEVKKYVSLKGEDSNCKCVDIYLPVPMLKVKDHFSFEYTLFYFNYFFM